MNNTHGGDLTEDKAVSYKTFYLDDDHNIVDSSKATKVVFGTYDENGRLIKETWGRTRRNLNNTTPKKKKIIARIISLFIRLHD